MITDRDIAMCAMFHQRPLRDLPVSDVRRYEQEMLAWMRANQAPLLAKLKQSGQLGEDDEKALGAALDAFAQVFRPTAANE